MRPPHPLQISIIALGSALMLAALLIAGCGSSGSREPAGSVSSGSASTGSASSGSLAPTVPDLHERLLSCDEVRAMWLAATTHFEQAMAGDLSLARSSSVAELGARLDALIAAETEQFAELKVEPGCSAVALGVPGSR